MICHTEMRRAAVPEARAPGRPAILEFLVHGSLGPGVYRRNTVVDIFRITKHAHLFVTASQQAVLQHVRGQPPVKLTTNKNFVATPDYLFARDMAVRLLLASYSL